MLPTLEQAIARIKAGDKVIGREYLADILQVDPQNEKAWLWLAAAVESQERRRYCLERVLEINPANKAAQRGLATLPPKPGRPGGPVKPEAPGPLLSRISLEKPPPPQGINMGPVKAAHQPAESLPAPEAEPLEDPPVPVLAEMTTPPPLEPTEPAAATSMEQDEPGSRGEEPHSPARTEEPGSEPEVVEDAPAANEEFTETENRNEDELPEEAVDSDQPERFWQTERGLLLTVGGAAAVLLLCAACLVAGLVFRPVADELPATVAAAVGTDTPTPTLTPVPPTPTATPTGTSTPTPSPTLTASATGTQVVADTPTVTATPTRTTTATPTVEQGQVLAVVSGDIITVLLDGAEVQVKYLLIDAPAVEEEGQAAEPFGPEALAFNRQLVQGRTVRLEQDVSQTDETGRLLRYVFVDELLVNEELLRQGLARVELRPADRRYAARFQEVEQAAREARTGIWSLDNSGGG